MPQQPDSSDDLTPPGGGRTITLIDIHGLAKSASDNSLLAVQIASRTEVKVDAALRPITRRAWEPYAQLVASIALVAILTLLALDALAR